MLSTVLNIMPAVRAGSKKMEKFEGLSCLSQKTNPDQSVVTRPDGMWLGKLS